MKKLLIIALCFAMTINSFATECLTPVKLLEENNPAPCRGYLFSPERELETRIKIKNNSFLEEELQTTNSIIRKLKIKESESDVILKLEQEKTELWKIRAETITLKYTSVEENRERRDFAFILMGIGLTVLAGYAIGAAAHGSK